ncbi:DnaT-like ssDNA-binding domain-containing protein, partial [Litorivivens sp.]
MIERPLIVSPTLAATLGLHEAILLQLLTEWAQLHGGEDSWQLIDKDQLQQLLPFWQEPEIDRILLQLQSQGVITLTSALNSSVRNVRFSLNSGNAGSTETSSPVRERTRAQPRSPAPRPQQTARGTSPYNRDAGATPIDSSWQPDRESINYLTRFHGVDPTFIDAILPEFIAYWRDKGDARA